MVICSGGLDGSSVDDFLGLLRGVSLAPEPLVDSFACASVLEDDAPRPLLGLVEEPICVSVVVVVMVVVVAV